MRVLQSDAIKFSKRGAGVVLCRNAMSRLGATR